MAKINQILGGLILSTVTVTAAMAQENTALEVVITKPKEGVTLEQALEADKALAAYIRTQKGFLSREVGTSKEGEIFVNVHWATLEDAEAAGAAFMNDPSGKAMLKLVDPSVFKHFLRQSTINGGSDMAASQGSVIEIVTFKLKPEVTVDDFRKIDKAVEAEYASKQPGFVSRSSAAGDNGEWLAIINWRSIEEAEASMAGFGNAAAAAEFMSKIDASTMSMKRYMTN